MPAPLVVFGIIAAISAIAGVAVGAAGRWQDKARNATFALIGMKRAGKSTWSRFLEGAEIPAGYEPTNSTEKLENTLKPEDMELKVTVYDMSGSMDSLQEWRERAKEVERVFFFVDITLLEDEGYFVECLRRARQVPRWEGEPPFLVATHADKDPGWLGGRGATDLRERPAVQELKTLLGATRVFIADLATETGRRDFTLEALRTFGDK